MWIFRWTLAVFFVLLVAVEEVRALFRDSRQAEFFSRLSSYDVVIPQKVTSTGEFLTHDVIHQHTLAAATAIGRHRRSADDQADEDSVGDPVLDAHSVHYKMQLSGRDVLLYLTPNVDFLSPGIVVERRTSDGNVTLTAPVRSNCFFTGSVRNDTESRAAVSTCHGLTGALKLQNEEYLIEPVKGHGYKGHPHPHLVYKRSAVPPGLGGPSEVNSESQSSCGTSEEYTKLFRERRQWEKAQGFSRNRRAKRSVSLERNVETLVVADKMMVGYYSNEDIETYILTVLNMVSSLYHDASIGNAINVVLVRVLLLESDENLEEGLEISQHADNTLKSFCRWQKLINPRDENHPNHHDVAILITRHNICTKSNEPCSTLGLAEVAGMCQPQRSCNVNEDSGLTLAYTIAHEMGHNFAMSHDGPQNGCQAPIGERQHVMAPHLNSDASPLVWSNCSREEITKFLDRDWGRCLDDEPLAHNFTFPTVPPGAMYDADHQCRLQYGQTAEYCEGIEEVCQTLWCRLDQKCVTKMEPAAEGTVCDKNKTKWCHRGKCTPIGDLPDAINGEWGPWSSWTECSRKCGAGVMFSERHCDNPMPAYGGSYCIGERKRYRMCNTENCPEDTPSFRAVQCSNFNDVPYKEELFNWTPVSTPATPCQLHCKPDGKFFSVMLLDTVADGTPCNPGTRDVCINGKCRHVACDWGIDSSAQEDRCGICHGDGTQCITIHKEFNQKEGLGYISVGVIPKGARNIRIEEVAESSNYVAVQGADDEFYLNGEWFIQWSGEYSAAGTTLFYQREGEREILHAPGPIKEDLKIYLLFQSDNPGLKYEYTIPDLNATRMPEFLWKYMDWTVCTVTCGGGEQVSQARCMEIEAGLVEDTYCNITEKPKTKFRTCNTHPCPARWWTGPWQHCSATCGDQGKRRRAVLCVRSQGTDEQLALNPDSCEQATKPHETEPCPHHPKCPEDPSWEISSWSDTCKEDPCSSQTRKVRCRLEKCDESSRPAETRPCSSVQCGTWFVGEWSECSQSCDGGLQFRKVSCINGLACPQESEPPSVKPCNNQSCNASSNTITSSNSSNSNFIFSSDASSTAVPSVYPSSASTSPTPDNVKHHRHHVHHHHGGTRRKTVGRQGHSNKNSKQQGPDDRPHSMVSDVSNDIVIEVPLGDAPGDFWNLSGIAGIPMEKLEGTPLSLVTFEDARYAWKTGPWSECSKPCGGGEHVRSVHCVDKATRTEVPEDNCYLHTQHLKPKVTDNCNIDPCLSWHTSEWSRCSSRCGPGTRHRSVSCPLPHRCNPTQKPNNVSTCNRGPCLDWVTGPWSQCTVTCGGGFQIRHVKCVNHLTREQSSGCSGEKPVHRQPCNVAECLTTKAELKGCRNELENKVCKSLRHMCTTYYFHVKCCQTCARLNRYMRQETAAAAASTSRTSRNHHQ